MQSALLYPAFAQVLLTIVLLMTLGGARGKALKDKAVRMKDVALGETDPWPERPKAIARSFQNQLETPILFYAGTAFATILQRVDTPMMVMAWTYVGFRYAHAFVHVNSNHVPTRFRLFLLSVITVTALWCWLVYRVASNAV
jgi:hypothetical protein